MWKIIPLLLMVSLILSSFFLSSLGRASIQMMLDASAYAKKNPWKASAALTLFLSVVAYGGTKPKPAPGTTNAPSSFSVIVFRTADGRYLPLHIPMRPCVPAEGGGMK